ncbi:dihydrodipicolinate synthase family protein [Natronosporangium hydrolyticum]|uniref:Dihydrodipicolinate synthase family protein n=1 Tax=Natronosporangium hydrolyticum TaxID=2811111 RepID=A0A895YCP8_9ACTN|nr:dihydrodipicolinate synthase family protein [Natronosporangium hydrolyticum]QSB13962.1 dihydrodipicolinate synthase family protein [Natronosporangium hydrolyticum]
MTLTGLYVPLITPFDHTGEVALDPLAALAHELLAAGADGLVALGTTAEPTALTPDERAAVLSVTAHVCRESGAPLIVGAHNAEALGALAGQPEVTAALTLVPPFIQPGEAGVLAYFDRLATHSPVPLVVYDVPHRTGQPLSTETLRRLAELSGVVGVKYAPASVTADAVALLTDPPADFAVLGGADQVISPLLALGAHGGILASAHVATAAFADLIAQWRGGDATTARALGGELAALSTALFAEPNPTVIKAVLHAQGRIPTATVRLPLLPADQRSMTAAARRAAAVDGPALRAA